MPIASKNRRSATHSWDNKAVWASFWRFAGVPLSYEADSVWLWALRRVHCDTHDFLQRHRCAIAIGVCTPLRWALLAKAFCKGSPRPIPRKRKRPVRTSGPKRKLEARRGTGPHTRRGCTVLDLGRCTGTYCFGVAGKLGRGPRVCKAKV